MAIFSRWMSGLLGQRRAPPQVPEGRCVYAVGDVHGRADLLDQLLERIWADAPATANTLIFVGDYVDRGPDSKAVVERLVGLDWPGWEIVMLRGNHEQVMLEFLQNPETYQAWRSFGGTETLISYGVRPPIFSNAQDLERARAEFAAAVPEGHRRFLLRLENSYAVGDYFFVHAGIRPTCPLDQQKTEDLLWIRDEFLASNKLFEKVIVHGHSPCNIPVLRKNRIGVDTGAYATNILTAVKLWGDHCEFLSSGD